LFRIMTNTYVTGLHRAQHRPSEYLTDPQPTVRARHHPRGPRWPNSILWLRCLTWTPNADQSR
jgi:RNA polymerase sigma-70 factor (ECF subfamily)